MPDLNDPRPGYVGRAPDMQPQLGETGIGGGSWNYTTAQDHGGPYQRFITGVDPVDGKWLEYLMAADKATPSSKGEVSFGGYIPDPGPPPVYRFQESKGYYAWMLDIDGRFEKQISAWFDQYSRQARALRDLPNARLEWNFDDKLVADAFRDRLLRDRQARAMFESGRLEVNWVPKPKDG